MENNKFDKEIKDMFNQHQPGLDHDDIWDNIEPKLKKKKKRRFFFFWFLGAGLAMLSYFAFQELNTASVISEAVTQTQSAINPTNIANDSDSPSRDLTNSETNNSEIETTISTDEKESLASTKNTNNAFPAATNTTRNNINTNNRKSISQQHTSISALAGSSATKEERNSDKDLVAKESENQLLSKTEDTEIKSNLKDKTAIEETSNNVMTNEEESPTKKTTKSNNQKTPNKRSPKVKKKKRKGFGWKWNWNKKAKKKKKKRKKTKPLKRAPWEIQLQTAVAPAVAYKNLKQNTTTAESSALLEKEKEANKQLEAFTFNLGLHFQHKRSGLLIASGLEYRQINERFYFYETKTETTFTTGTISQTENYNGDIIDTETGLKPIETTTTTEQKFYNKHRFISLPIGIGKAWSNRNNGFKILTGVDLNLMYRFKGTVYNAQLDPIKMAKTKNAGSYNQVFKPTAGIGLWISGEYSRAINPRLSWLIAPKLQIPLSSSMKSDYDLSQKHFLLQFDLGVNYLLNPKQKKNRKKR